MLLVVHTKALEFSKYFSHNEFSKFEKKLKLEPLRAIVQLNSFIPKMKQHISINYMLLHPLISVSSKNIVNSLHKKWSFPLRISSVNVTKTTISCGFSHISWKNPECKTSFFGHWFAFHWMSVWGYLACPKRARHRVIDSIPILQLQKEITESQKFVFISLTSE